MLVIKSIVLFQKKYETFKMFYYQNTCYKNSSLKIMVRQPKVNLGKSKVNQSKIKGIKK